MRKIHTRCNCVLVFFRKTFRSEFFYYDMVTRMDDQNETNLNDNESELLKDGKNAYDAFCKNENCDSMVFRSNTCPMTRKEATLPNGKEDEKVSHFWSLNDMYQFENISFTKTTDSKSGKIKYLACCDCEHGPIGYQDLDTQVCYVDVNKVRYKKG